MEIAAEVWFWVAPKATGTARSGREPRRHGACIYGSYPSNRSGTCRSADGPVAVIALAKLKGDVVQRSALDIVERGINRLKDFRAVCTRFDKRGHNYHAGVLIACIMLWL